MRDKFQPWMPAIFCTCLTLITIVSFVLMSMGRTTNIPSLGFLAAFAPLLSFLPMCFYFVGASLSQLRQENLELREQIQELISKSGAEKQVA